MSGRYQLLDSDEQRLPDGMDRVGYDADTQVYTYQDEEGNYWQGEPGVRYGHLRRTGTGGHINRDPQASSSKLAALMSEDWRYMAPFLVMVMVILLAVWHFFGPTFVIKCDDGLRRYVIVPGDTCWDIAESSGTTVDDLTRINRGLNCDKLRPGMQICAP